MEQYQSEYQAFHANDVGYERFVRALFNRDIALGSTVTQTELCDILDMSVTPLRECLVLLAEYGLVQVRPRAGVRVVFPDATFFRENMQFRSVIETNALPSFVEKADIVYLESLRSSHQNFLKVLADSDDPEKVAREFSLLDRELHTEMVKVLKNRSISAAHIRLQQNVQLSRLVHVQLTYRKNTLDTVEEHLLLIDAVIRRDLEGANAALKSHLQASTHRTFT